MGQNETKWDEIRKFLLSVFLCPFEDRAQQIVLFSYLGQAQAIADPAFMLFCL